MDSKGFASRQPIISPPSVSLLLALWFQEDRVFWTVGRAPGESCTVLCEELMIPNKAIPDVLAFGSDDLRLPDELRAPIRAHLTAIRKQYVERGWAGRVGFGRNPALLVIDLALWW